MRSHWLFSAPAHFLQVQPNSSVAASREPVYLVEYSYKQRQSSHCRPFWPTINSRQFTVAVAQLDRASDCGSEGRGFESLQPPCPNRFQDKNLSAHTAILHAE